MYTGKKLLIVDDSATERHILKEAVSKLGFTVFEAVNGEEGIQKANELHPDLILMDVVMPGLNGFQATKEIVKNPDLKDVPIIICTTKHGESDKLWGKRQGANAYLVKPVNAEELVTTIKSLLK